MIINTISKGDRYAYYCNGTNDDIELVTFITQLRNNGFSNFTVEIIGNFGKSNAAPITVDNTGYTQITLDFAKCNRIYANRSDADTWRICCICRNILHCSGSRYEYKSAC